MIVEFGHFALVLSLVIAFLQCFSGVFGAHIKDNKLMLLCVKASDISFISIIIAFLALIWSYINSDFSVENVVKNSLTLKPLIYKISGTWGNHEGSMLLWALVGAGFGNALAHSKNHLSHSLKIRALGVQGLIVGLVICYIVFASNPFVRLDNPPLQGNDLNPLLQDPALAIHPPFLYLGYVGLSLVYSLAVAGLLEGKVDAAWAKVLRPWVLASWMFLTIGITLGAYWAYYELGWGGWWFWDPVENASFMPWLLSTALLHSAIVTEKRGALAAWTLLLSILAFSLSLLGTFLVRSGVITSVHAFALDPERGVWILLIFGLFTGGGLLLYGIRSAALASDRGLFKPISRETALILNNVFLIVATFTILVGTLYPLVGEAVYGRAISVGAPYFNAVFIPLMSVILVFLPVASFFSWKRAKLLPSFQKLAPAIIISIMGGLIVAYLAKNKPMSAVGISIGVWLILGAISELYQKLGGNKTPFLQLFDKLYDLRKSAKGMFLAHLGVGIFTIGAVFASSFQKEQVFAIAQGETINFNNAKFTLEKVVAIEGANFYSDVAQINMSKDGGLIKLYPSRRYYPAAKMPTTEVDRRGNIFGETYIALGEPNMVDGQPKWTIRLYYNPMIAWIFSGALIIALGGFYSLSDKKLRIGIPKAAKNINKEK